MIGVMTKALRLYLHRIHDVSKGDTGMIVDAASGLIAATVSRLRTTLDSQRGRSVLANFYMKEGRT
jgi:hypothetical protein